MSALFRFLGSTAGRLTRIVAGIVLIAAGLTVIAAPAGWIVAVIGVVPLLAGLVDVCVFAPLFKLPFSGTSLRQAVK